MKRLLFCSSILAILIGIVLVIGGIWGVYFTYQNVSAENITTPQDASIAGKQVRGIFTLKSQADVIREHTLKITGGKRYAEMPRQISKTDEKGNDVLGVDGKPVMVPNTARDIWITATTLITALHLAIFAYVFSGLFILFGFVSIWTGVVFCFLSRERKEIKIEKI